MKPREERDWPFAAFMAGLLFLALVAAMLDPSCHRRSDPSTTRWEPSR